MNALRRSDVVAILDLVVEIGELEFDRPYPAAVVAGIADLVPSASLSYQEIDCVGRRTTVIVSSTGVREEDPADDALYWALGPCPIVRYRTTSRDVSAMRLSDVIASRAYRELPIYRDYYAPHQIEHMLDLGLEAGPERQRSFILFRREGDGNFSERDRALLTLLRPHLARLEENAALRRRLVELSGPQSPDHVPGWHARLTAREREVVSLVARGRTNAEIARELWIAPGTVKKHLEHVYEKIGVGRRAAAAGYAASAR